MRATVQVKEVTSKKWMIPLIIFICSIIFEILLGNTLFYHSYNSIRGVQKFFNEKLHMEIFNNDNDKNLQQENILINNYLSFQKEGNNTNIEEDTITGTSIFSEIINFFNTNLFLLIISAIAYNFVNIYKIFILTYTIFLSNFICSTLCFIFHTPRPYMVYYSIKGAVMFNEWGSPDTQVATLIAFSLAFYETIIKNKRLEKSIVAKIIIFIIIGLIAFIDIFLLFATGNLAYNQIIFSICIGIVTYQIIFYIFKVDVNNSEQLFNFLKIKTSYYIFINLILFAFQFILNLFIIDKSDEDYYFKNINEQQKRLPYSIKIYHREYFYLNRGNLCNVICYFMNIVAFISMKLELHWTFKGDYDSWSSRNFEKHEQEGDDGLLNISQDDYIIRNATQWNHTGFCKGIVRLFAVLVLSLCCLVPTYLVYTVITSNEVNGYFFIIALPLFLITFELFFLLKIILQCLKMTKKA